jgi:hypothetical protein
MRGHSKLVERAAGVRCLRLASVTVAMLALGCVRQAVTSPHAPVERRSFDDSLLCEHLADRFVGLPALTSDAPGDSRPSPAVGRWWLRSCAATRERDDLHIRIRGPGWYFVDETDGSLSLHQQVPFDLSIELHGDLSMTSSRGVVSMWFTPDEEPKVDLRVSGDLDVRPSSAWGTVLSLLPLVSLRDMAAERFTETASNALRQHLREGATVTYDIAAGQADATLGKLVAGQSPENAFGERLPWLINERLSLDSAALHVLGPVPPGPKRMDVNVERGAGITYHAVCVQDMVKDYPSLASGQRATLITSPRLASGSVTGMGKHTADFRVDDCSFYLVIAGVEPSSAIVSLRVRA